MNLVEIKKIRENCAMATNAIVSSNVLTGVLLCEGDENSIDYKLYTAVYPHLFVIPSDGVTQLKKRMPSYRKLLQKKGIPVYALIDRDGLSKKQIRALEDERDIYVTKLPFIENCISAPEIMSILCKIRGVEYKTRYNFIRQKLMQFLADSLKQLLPINTSIGHEVQEGIALNDSEETTEEVPIVEITIKITDANGFSVEKTVNENNIMYTYRAKEVANQVANTMGIWGRSRYYKFLSSCLDNPELRSRIVKRVRTHLPKIGSTEKIKNEEET